jgi:porin
LLALLAGAACPDPANAQSVQRAEPESWFERWTSRDTMTGDWGGARTDLEDLGFDLFANTQMSFLAGYAESAPDDTAYASLTSFGLGLDLDRLLGLGGASLVVSATHATGAELSLDFLEGITPSAVAARPGTRLWNLHLEQGLADGAADVRVGWISVLDEFAASPLYGTYLSTAFNANPGSMPLNDLNFSAAPTGQWGLRVRVEPTKESYVMAGFYNGDPISFVAATPGDMDFSFNPGDGLLSIVEAGYRIDQDGGASSLPGNLKVGAYIDNSELPVASDLTRTSRGQWGLYVLLDRMVYREEGTEDQGLTPWAAFAFAKDDATVLYPYFFSAGAVYQGLFEGRDDDSTSIGLAWGKFDGSITDADREITIELAHTFQITPWFTLQPDAQLQIDPRTVTGTDYMTVFGFSAFVVF